MRGILRQFRPHILVLIALLALTVLGWHELLRNGLTDLRFAWDKRQATGEVVVIAIDAPSIEAIGIWPWPRALHAALLQRLQRAGVQDVAFDVDFSAVSDPASDGSFADALKAAGGGVILPAFKQPGSASSDRAIYVNRPLPQFADHAWSALVNVAVEADGRVRSYPSGTMLGDEYLPSMAVLLAGQIRKSDNPFLIDFGIDAASVPKVSYVDVLKGDATTLAKLRDKRVIIGGTALELGDRFNIPNARIVSGPVLQAMAAETILQNRELRRTSDLPTLASLVFLAGIMM